MHQLSIISISYLGFHGVLSIADLAIFKTLQGPALLVHQIGDIGLSEEAEAYGITDLFLGDELSAPKVVSFPPRHILRGPGISGSCHGFCLAAIFSD